MIITNIDVSNFKSIAEISSSLQKYTVLIGPNAAGKTNIVAVFQFLSDVFKHGLDNAISLQGGRDFIRNINIGSEKDLKIGVEIDSSMDDYFSIISKRVSINREFFKNSDNVSLDRFMRALRYAFKINKIKYDFTLYFLKTRKDFKVISENFHAEGDIYNIKRPFNYKKITDEDFVSKGFLNISRKENKVSGDFICEKEGTDLNFFDAMGDISNLLKFYRTINRNKLFLQSEHMPGYITNIGNFFKGISIYNVDPKLSKTSSRFSGKTELEFDGNNLVVVLKNIMEDKELKYKFSLLIKKMLPFIEDVAIERFYDRTLIASIKERYTKKRYIPASFMSDGTINIIAFIIILYFENKNIVIIEEPERNIHPSLISKVVSMLKEVSTDKQIIVTTHHPEIVRYSDVNNLCLVKRDNNGYTIIKHVSDLKDLSVFLEEDIGVDDLFIDNILVNIK